MEGLEQIVSDILESPLDEVSDDTSPKTTRNWDSLRHINLVLALEQKYGVKFAPSEIMLIGSLAEARALLEQKGVTA